MSQPTTLHIAQEAHEGGKHAIKLTLERLGQPRLAARAEIEFALTPPEQEELRWYTEYYLTVDADVLEAMGEVGEHALPELKGITKEHLRSVLDRARDPGLLTHLGGTWYTIHPALPWFLRQLFARHYDGQQGRSTATAALLRRAQAHAQAALRDYQHYQGRAVRDEADAQQLLADIVRVLTVPFLSRLVVGGGSGFRSVSRRRWVAGGTPP